MGTSIAPDERPLLTSPNGGEALKFGQQFTITWTVPMEVSGQVKGFDLTLSTELGTTFFGFSKPGGKIKKSGRKFLSEGTINGQDLGVLFPNGATRVIRITRPGCGITILRVVRSGEQLSLAASLDADPVLPQQVWP